MGPGAGQPQAFGLEQAGEVAAHIGKLVAGLTHVGADGGPDLDHRLHHLALHLVAQARRGGGQKRVDVRAQLALGVDDHVLLFDADREQARIRGHQAPRTNVGTTLPAPAVTLSRAAADSRVRQPVARPSKR